MARGCQTCGTLNPDHGTTCEYCGASLPATPVYRDPFVRRRDTPWEGDRYPVQSRPTPAAYPAARANDPSVGFLLELLPGLFGFLGIGYLWAGETLLGIALLLGYWAFWAIVAVATIATLGLLLCFLPFFLALYVAAPIASAVLLQRRLRARRALVVAPILPYPTYPY